MQDDAVHIDGRMTSADAGQGDATASRGANRRGAARHGARHGGAGVRRAWALGLCGAFASATAAAGEGAAGGIPAAPTHPYRIAQPQAAPDELQLVVEIPTGGMVKYEIRDDGLLHADRFLSMPVAYPANYGSLPSTLAGDGDPLDAVVLTRVPLQPGSALRFRAIGVLRMHDRGDADEKLIGVPVDAVDPTYAAIRDIGDLPAIERQRIEAFFRVYKDLPAGGDGIRLEGFGDAAEARRIAGEAIRRAAGR